MPPPDPATIAADIGTALQANLNVAQLVEDLYAALGAFDVAKAFNLGGGYALIVRPGWGLLNEIPAYVFLAEIQAP